jgi:hypothetical protein
MGENNGLQIAAPLLLLFVVLETGWKLYF